MRRLVGIEPISLEHPPVAGDGGLHGVAAGCLVRVEMGEQMADPLGKARVALRAIVSVQVLEAGAGELRILQDPLPAVLIPEPIGNILIAQEGEWCPRRQSFRQAVRAAESSPASLARFWKAASHVFKRTHKIYPGN